MNLVEKLEPGYFADMCSGATFAKDGRVLEVSSVASNYAVRCSDVTDPNNITPVSVSSDFFTGWKAFSHPDLGYRKIGSFIVFIEKQQSVSRGLRPRNLRYRWSEVTSALANSNAVTGLNFPTLYDAGLLKQVFFPKFDSLNELGNLLSGKTVGLVLNENILIEPNVANDSDNYNIYYNTRKIGEVSSAGSFTFTKPAHMKMYNNSLRTKGVSNA